MAAIDFIIYLKSLTSEFDNSEVFLGTFMLPDVLKRVRRISSVYIADGLLFCCIIKMLLLAKFYFWVVYRLSFQQ